MQTIYAFSYNPVIATGTNTTGTNWRMAYQQPIMLYRGTSNTIRIVVFSSNQHVVNLTNYGIEVQIVDKETKEYFVTKAAVITSPATGVASITFTEADLQNLQHRFYHVIAKLLGPSNSSEILYLDDNYGAFTPVTIENAWDFNEASALPPDLTIGSIGGNLIPSTNNFYSLGNLSLRWDHIYANIADIGSFNITGNTITSSDTSFGFFSGTHGFTFTDVAPPGIEEGTGSILKLDETLHGEGPTFETWYGDPATPWDPPGQHSLDIRAANANSYVELASYDWNNYVGVNNSGVKIWTNWNVNSDNYWTFGTNGWFTLPAEGRMVSSSGNTSVTMGNDDIRLVTTDVDGSTLHTTLFDTSGDVYISRNLLPGFLDTGPTPINSIGTLEHPWKDLYISNTTIYMGGIPLSVDSGGNLTVNGSSVNSGLKVSEVPLSSIGIAGDKQGDIAFDSNHMYYCSADYDGTNNVWKRVAWSNDTW